MTPTTAVHATGLVKTFDGFRAVDGIDLEVRQGEIFGVLGPNGAGKTTTLKMLATLLPIDAGQAWVFGVDVAREPHRIRQPMRLLEQFSLEEAADKPIAQFSRAACGGAWTSRRA